MTFHFVFGSFAQNNVNKEKNDTSTVKKTHKEMTALRMNYFSVAKINVVSTFEKKDTTFFF